MNTKKTIPAEYPLTILLMLFVYFKTWALFPLTLAIYTAITMPFLVWELWVLRKELDTLILLNVSCTFLLLPFLFGVVALMVSNA